MFFYPRVHNPVARTRPPPFSSLIKTSIHIQKFPNVPSPSPINHPLPPPTSYFPTSHVTLTFRLSARTASVSFCFKRGYNIPDPPPSKKQRTDSAQPDPDSDTTTGKPSRQNLAGLEATISLTLSYLPFPGLMGQRKYSYFNHKDLDLLDWPEGVSAELMAASRSANSWNRHVSAVNCLSKFCISHGIIQSWPIDLKTLRSFVNWALTKHKLSCSSARVYLSDLKLAHNLRGLKTVIFKDFFIKSMLKGAENLALYENISKRARLIMTLPLLKILGHEIAKSSWSSDSKRVFWSACCLAFFGSFRMCEILMSSEKQFSEEHLSWSRVTFPPRTMQPFILACQK
jgi:hypothetical protein